MSDFRIYLGDCLEVMAEIPGGSVDMVLADLPYGSTACRWDSVIPFEPLWAEYRRIVRNDGAIVLTASQPFTTALIASNLKEFAYCWVWDKGVGANFVQAKRMPLKTTEDVCVFSPSGKTPRYFPQTTPREKPRVETAHAVNSGSIPLRGPARDTFGGKEYPHFYPKALLSFSCRTAGDRGLHPTQKPVAMLEYLIKTYTQEGETVLDNTMGSASTGVAALNTGRKFLGIEKTPEYFAVAKNRLYQAQPQLLAAE